MDKIEINNISVYGYHGLFPSEKELGQKFVVDLEIFLSLKEAGITDNLNNTINYVEVYKKVEHVIKSNSFNLVESIAENIAQDLLMLPLIEKVSVRVTKPHIPVENFSGSVSVQIIRIK